MRPLDTIIMAFKSVFTHKLRSILTILGIIIGVSSIVIIITLGDIAETALKAQFIDSNKNIISINYNPISKENETNNIYTNINEKPLITQNDIIEIRKNKQVKNLILTNSDTVQLNSSTNTTVNARLLGIEESSYSNKNIEITKGKNLTTRSFVSGATEGLITQELENQLFKNKERTLNSIIRVKGYPIKIIGIYKEKDNSLNFDTNEIIIPLALYQNIYKKTSIDSIEVESYSTDEMEITGNEVIGILNKNLPSEFSGQYEILNLEDIQKAISGVTRTLTFLIGGIAGISLIVAGIGIMNMMLFSVTERTKEIGIRKALGATRRIILLQFLIESLLLTLSGGAIGIILSYICINIIALIMGWATIISFKIIIISLLFLVLLGIIFGILPANKAAKLNPVDAFRYE